MTLKFYDSSEVEGKYMEVIITSDDGEEHIYWVNIQSMPSEEDEYDWSIEKALGHHKSLGFKDITEDDAEASEPFSRDSSEFTFID